MRTSKASVGHRETAWGQVARVKRGERYLWPARTSKNGKRTESRDGTSRKAGGSLRFRQGLEKRHPTQSKPPSKDPFETEGKNCVEGNFGISKLKGARRGEDRRNDIFLRVSRGKGGGSGVGPSRPSAYQNYRKEKKAPY